MAETAKSKKSATAERVAEQRASEREWAELIEKLPATVDPLDLSDWVQIELIARADTFSKDEKGNPAPLMHEISDIIPHVFQDQEEFEEWRKSLSILHRLPVYITIYQRYVSALGESDGSTSM